MPYGFITKIKNVKKHSNADRLQVGECFGNQVIVGLDTKVNELGVYFATDSRLSEEYASVNDLVRRKDADGNNAGGYLEPQRRHIRALKLRGEISDGLFMPLDSLSKFGNIGNLSDGDCIDVFNGKEICCKYIPRTNKKSGAGGTLKQLKKNLYPTFFKHTDTTQLAYNLAQFKKGDLCYITSKVHGTSQRTANVWKVQEISWFISLIGRLFNIKPEKTYETVTGTRRTIVDLSKSLDGGFYSDNAFRKKWHDFFDGKLAKGETVYYEVVGWVNNDTTIMPQCSNKKTKDKEFIKKYGDTTIFSYGCEKGKNKIFVYRMTMVNEDGEVFEYPWELVKTRAEQMGAETCYEYEKFFFTTKNSLMKKIEKYYDGADPIGITHIQEGAVVRIDSSPTFKAFKHKNFNFKVLEGIIKSEDVLDMEESADLEEG